MAAGQGFKTFTTGEVLTAGDVNGYLMQGVLVFASTAARDAAITSPQEGQFAFTKDTNSLFYYDGAAWVASGATGDIEGVTAGIGISGGGTSGTVTVTNSMATAIDAKGDLVAGTGADTFAKLTVGANGTTLVADSTTATGLVWQTPATGGMTLISTTSLTGSSVTLSSIPQTYKNLQLVLRDFYPATSGTSIGIKINADSGSNYSIVKTRTSSTSVSGGTGTIISLNDNTTESGNADTNNSAVFNFYDYTQTLRQVFDGLLIYNTTGAVAVTTKIDGSYIPSTSAAVTSLVIGPVTGNFGGGTALLYGVS
jgi:hypothetical protein